MEDLCWHCHQKLGISIYEGFYKKMIVLTYPIPGGSR
jgi:hypothetical protein